MVNRQAKETRKDNKLIFVCYYDIIYDVYGTFTQKSSISVIMYFVFTCRVYFRAELGICNPVKFLLRQTVIATFILILKYTRG